MRISHLYLENFGGVQRAEISGLGSEPAVILAGQNGTGKSLILRAIVGAWRGVLFNWNVGPWGSDCKVHLGISLSDDEYEAAAAWRVNRGGSKPERSDVFEVRYRVNRDSGPVTEYEHGIFPIFRDMAFRQQNPFCSVDLIPAGRFFGLSASAQIDLEPLQWHRIEDERNSQARSETLSSGLVGMGEVTRYLAAIDYKWFMAQRANEPISDDYGAIAELLLGATGKTLLRPVMNQENTGVQIQVELPSGNVHGIHQLSSGEIEVLGLIYFVRRLASQGGVLLIDEPEQHLHPSLQAVLFEAAKSLSGRSQLIAATHSVKLISSVGSSAILQLKSPASGDENQVSKFEDQSAKIDLIANLGMTAADILQNDLMVVVEGKTDGPWLQELFPVELGRAHVRVAGNFHEVLAAHRMLNESPSGIPWICLSDRDLMSDSDLTALKEKYPQLHVWPRRAIESMLLEPNLLRAVLRSAGLRKTEDESLEILRNAADGLKQEVLKQLVTREIAKRFPAPEKPSEGSNVEKLEEHWISYAAVAQERASAVRRVQEEKSEELDARWDGEWQSLVEPKAALRRVSAEVRIFSKHAHLVNSLIHVAASEPELMPGGFAEFRSLLRSCLGLG